MDSTTALTYKINIFACRMGTSSRRTQRLFLAIAVQGGNIFQRNTFRFTDTSQDEHQMQDHETSSHVEEGLDSIRFHDKGCQCTLSRIEHELHKGRYRKCPVLLCHTEELRRQKPTYTSPS